MKKQLHAAARLIKSEYPEVDIEVIVRLLEAAFWSDTHIGQFVADWCRMSYGKAYTRTEDLHAAYVRWCRENNERAYGKSLFGAILKELGLKRFEHDGKICWRGIVLIRKS